VWACPSLKNFGTWLSVPAFFWGKKKSPQKNRSIAIPHAEKVEQRCSYIFTTPFLINPNLPMLYLFQKSTNNPWVQHMQFPAITITKKPFSIYFISSSIIFYLLFTLQKRFCLILFHA
jgi:hypothetical protein